MKKTVNTLIDNINKLLGPDRTNYWLSKECGITQATLSRLVNDKIDPKLSSLDAIAEALNVTTAELITEKLELDIPQDIMKKMVGLTPSAYEAIRGILNALDKERSKKAAAPARSPRASKSR